MLWWLLLYNAASLFVQIFIPKRFANGFSGKITKRWVRSQWTRHFIRYYGWLGIFAGIFTPNWWHTTPIWGVFWLVATLFVVDDYLFGDDERGKKLWEGSRNKVKWLMDLPPAPEEVPTTR